MRRAAVVVFAALLTLGAGLAARAASTVADFGPAVGDDLSSIVVARDAAGNERTIADLSGPNGLVLEFNRSIDWCPFCKAQALELDAATDSFAQRGYGVVILSTDTVDILARYVAERQPKLTLISDADSTIITTLGMLDPIYPEGNRHYGVPYPATVVLAPDGVVKAVLLRADLYGQDNGYRERITPDDVLAAIDGLADAS